MRFSKEFEQQLKDCKIGDTFPLQDGTLIVCVQDYVNCVTPNGDFCVFVNNCRHPCSDREGQGKCFLVASDVLGED